MTAADVLGTAAATGVELFMKGDGTLGYRGARDAVAALLPELRARKPELLALLSPPAPMPCASSGPPPQPPPAPADAEAARLVRAWRYLLRTGGNLDAWCTYIDTAGCSLADARERLTWQYGAARVLAVAVPDMRSDP